MKTCRTCKEEKPLRDFPKSDRSNDGYATRCKACEQGAETPKAKPARRPIRSGFGEW